ncbi:MAG: hypothetical protein IKO65_11005 [Victivallales bacterium]|nr:hypothetical protein [Victivallales bacterium]
MTKRLSLLLFVLLACFGVFAENLLRNASLAEPASNGAWPATWEPQSGVEFEVVSYEDGTKGIVISRADANANVVQYGVTMEDGVEYRFTAKVRGATGAQGCIYIERSDPSYWCMLKEFTCTGDWQEVVVTGIMPDQGSKPYAVFRAKTGSKVEFTAPVLDVTPGKLQNGSFNAGGKCWTLENAVAEDSGDKAHGKLVKLNGTEAPARISQAGIQVKGGQLYKLSYDVKGGTDRQFQDIQGATWFRVAAYDGNQLMPGNEIWQDSFSSWQHKSLTFTPDRDMEVTIVGELKNPGTVYFDNITLVPTTSPVLPVELALDSPWSYHDSTVAGTQGAFSGAAFLSIPAATVRFAFNGEMLSKPGAPEVSFEFAVPAEVGEYSIEAVALDADGKVIASAKKVFRVVPPPQLAEGAHVVTFDAKRVMYVDGEPFFPIGSWNYLGEGNSVTEAAEMMAKMGFNMVLCNYTQMDKLADYGLLAMVMVPSEAQKERTPEELSAWLEKPTGKIIEAMNHPSTIAWFSTDEPAWGGRPVAPYQRLYETMSLLDPYHPVFLNEAPRGKVEDLRPYANVCDTYGVDIYPIPSPNSHSDLVDKTMTSVGKYTDICDEVVRGRKPLWMTLQGFAWGKWNKSGVIIYPTREETRFMIYEAISHGATGLMYWGTMSVPTDHPFVADLAANLHEVEALSRYLVGDTIEGEVTCDVESIRICQKRTAEGDDLWIVLNESPGPVTATFTGKLPAKLRVVSEGRNVIVENGSFTEEFGPYGMHIYRDAAKTIAPPLKRPSTQRLAEKVELPTTFEKASWVWYPGQNLADGDVEYLRNKFRINNLQKINSAVLSIVVDDYFKCTINGHEVMRQEEWQCAWTLDVLKYLREGENELVVKGMDGGGAPCGALFALALSDGTLVLSGDHTQASKNGRDGWVKAEVLGAYGCGPWGNQITAVPYVPADCDRDFEK